jgi:hypothetical protein
MTLFIVLILAAVLVVIAIMLIKKTAREKLSGPAPSINSGSIPDQAGTKGDGNSALSSGKQG